MEIEDRCEEGKPDIAIFEIKGESIVVSIFT